MWSGLQLPYLPHNISHNDPFFQKKNLSNFRIIPDEKEQSAGFLSKLQYVEEHF